MAQKSNPFIFLEDEEGENITLLANSALVKQKRTSTKCLDSAGMLKQSNSYQNHNNGLRKESDIHGHAQDDASDVLDKGKEDSAAAALPSIFRRNKEEVKKNKNRLIPSIVEAKPAKFKLMKNGNDREKEREKEKNRVRRIKKAKKFLRNAGAFLVLLFVFGNFLVALFVFASSFLIQFLASRV